METSKRVWMAVAMTLVAGCASYHPAPISARDNAAAIQDRGLNNPRLQRFIAAALDGDKMPPRRWDLSTLTLAALYYHPDIAVAHARLAAAQADATTAAQRPNPTLTLAGAYGQAVASLAPPAGVLPITVGPTIDFLIQTFNKRGYRTTQAVHLADAARWDLATAGWQVRARVRAALLKLWAAQRRLALTRRELALQEQLVQLVEQRFAAGAVSSLDVMRARVAKAQVALAVRGLQQTQAVARVELATALGMAVHALDGVPLSLSAFDRPPVLPSRVDTGDMRRRALTLRTDVRAALQDYAAAESALQLQIANQYPNVTIGPGYNYDVGVNKYIFNLGIDGLPVFNQNQGPIRKARAQRREAAARFTGLQAQVIGAIDAAAAAYRTAAQAVSTGDDLLAAQRRRARQTAAEFRAGAVDRVTLVTARLEAAVTALARFDAVVRQRQAEGDLEDALQQPLFDPGHWPVVPEQDPLAAAGDTP